MLKGKKIVVGISGGIAAYKTLWLIRAFVKAGASVRVVATTHAMEFVTRLTLETLSQHKVYVEMFAEQGYTTEHISICDWADLCVVAPATANIIAKYANGIADDALSTTLLALNTPVFVAPAMNTQMYGHPATRQNIETLRKRGVHILSAVEGPLACGVEGVGRMMEPDDLFSEVVKFCMPDTTFSGKQVMVTAGPTYEKIDPVRFIGNFSSGKMGFAIAEAFAKRGATVHLITGPTHLNVCHEQVHRIDVLSAQEMAQEVFKIFDKVDIAILSAAVADYTPLNVSTTKIKKEEEDFSLSLRKTQDILASIGKTKRKDQCLVGFALETDNEFEHAKAKLRKKNLDFIVLNSLREEGAGFGCSTNRVSIIDRDLNVEEYPLKEKQDVAFDIVAKVESFYSK